MTYFIIGTTLLSKDSNTTWSVIKNEVFKGGMGGPNCKGERVDAEIEKFKLGNLDSLLHTSENMQKLETQMEGFLRKIERQYLDITGETSTNFSIETQDSQGNSIEQFLFKFKWEEKNFSRKKPLGEIVQNIASKMNRLESDFRQKTQTYQEKKNVQTNLAQKEGNLYVRDLVDVLNPQIVRDRDFVYSDNVTTVVAVVPKAKSKVFLEKYATVTDQVLPLSAKQFNFEDKDGLSLYRVLLFTKELNKKNADQPEDKKKVYRAPVENFIYKMREELGITVREFHYNKKAYEQRENARRDIQRETQEITTILTQACQSHFSALYNAYLHLKHLRLVVDIASRFGQREPTVTAILAPAGGKQKQVITNLMKLFCEPSQMGMYGTKEELEDTEDFYPFVYIPINIF